MPNPYTTPYPCHELETVPNEMLKAIAVGVCLACIIERLLLVPRATDEAISGPPPRLVSSPQWLDHTVSRDWQLLERTHSCIHHRRCRRNDGGVMEPGWQGERPRRLYAIACMRDYS